MKTDEAKTFIATLSIVGVVILGINFIEANPKIETIKKELVIECLEQYRQNRSSLNQPVTPEVIDSCTNSSIKLLNSKGSE